ncbi:apoptosis-inducing factor homolog A-like [Vigna unguiculata]|uniref:AMID-like mitochondrial oxidoreductase n=1 Tax=Vigna unguiculata TaxID=3917 RepID=A0A4D6LHE4_VIGUN|nr:apoptosis-inducing factor homolog A-like [Vigna unguiculata]QCD87997.1 AMID-like mitochondrial oxidoreductase [Vigna unguiculata]
MENPGGKKRVVVVGGGIAGSLVAKSLQFTAHVTLIDPKEYFEITWAGLRSMVQPSFAQRSVINHSEYLCHGNIITSSAVNVTETDVITADGQRVPFDYLIIATGHADEVPKNRRDRLNQFVEFNEKIRSARSIMIVGGGPTGVELAAEIAVDFPDKKITIVHKGPRLLDFVGTKAADKTLKWLQSRNIAVKLEQSIDLNELSYENKTYRTSNGETFEADCYFLCLGKPLASAWLEGTMLRHDMNEEGRIKVDEKLRVIGRRNIFAIGDITDIPEIKQGFAAQQHAEVVVKNLKVMIDGGKDCSQCRMENYKPQLPMAIVSLGRKDAVAQLPLMTIIGRVPGYIKSADLFVGRTRRQMGLDPHSVHA